MKNKILPKAYLTIILILIIATGINPIHEGAWLGEISLLLFALLFLVTTYKKFQFSNLAYTLIFIYMLFPLIGGHYTFNAIDLSSIDSLIDPSRNNLDRVVHFLSGLLLTLPVKELLIKRGKVKGIWKNILPVAVILGAGALYEIIEWGAVAFFANKTLETNFLGMQGDIWDSQKDMLMALFGSLTSIALNPLVKKLAK